MDNIINLADNDDICLEWAHLAHLDKLNIQIIGLAYEYDDADRSWADDRTGKAPANVRAEILDKERLPGTTKARGIEKQNSEEARP